jgi:hypothetical protein
MLKFLPAKFTDFAVKLYDWGTNWAGKASHLFKLPEVSSRLSRYFSKPSALLWIELFVALSLTMYYFFLLLPLAAPPRNFQNVAYFTEYAQHPYTREDFTKDCPDVKTRLPGPMLTGWLTDTVFERNKMQKNDQEAGPWSTERTLASGVWSYNVFWCTFAAYHASWLLLLFGLLIRYRADALLIILGTFSGLMLNMSAIAWQYFFPWDLPSMFFFTWAILTYDNSKKVLPLMTVVWLGALFKETTLCCSLLILLG